MTKLDLTDWLIVSFISYSAVYLSLHPSDVNFATFCGLSVAFHLTRVYDDKRVDA